MIYPCVMIENIIKTPEEEKFRKINLTNKGFQKRIGKVIGGKFFMKLIGFQE